MNLAKHVRDCRKLGTAEAQIAASKQPRLASERYLGVLDGLVAKIERLTEGKKANEQQPVRLPRGRDKQANTAAHATSPYCMNSPRRAGAEGVGKAATESFVLSFIAILILDFFIGIVVNSVYYLLWPTPIGLV